MAHAHSFPTTPAASSPDILTNHDSLNRLTDQTVHYDDGTRVAASYDAAEQFNWTSSFVNYDDLNRITGETVYHDDSSRRVVGNDAADQFGWLDSAVDYDSLNQLTGQTVHYDDGSYTIVLYDPDNQVNWQDDLFTYDSLGALTAQNLHFDDNTRRLRLRPAGPSPLVVARQLLRRPGRIRLPGRHLRRRNDVAHLTALVTLSAAGEPRL